MLKTFKIGKFYQTLLETCHFNGDVLNRYFKEWNGKYIYFTSKIIFYSQIGQMMLIDVFHGCCIKLFERVWTYVCMHLPKPMMGKKFRQSNGVYIK